MSTRNNIQAELESLGATMLAAVPLSTSYQVPDGYFSQFDQALSGRLQQEEALPEPVLSITPELPFRMPEGFFEQFSGNVLQKIRADEASEQAAATESWSRETPYRIPAGYFEQFPARVWSLVQKEHAVVLKRKTAKKVALFRTMRVAASVALIIFAGLGIMRYNMPGATKAGATAQIDFSGIPKSAIADYINQNIDDFDMDMIVNNLHGKTASLSSTHIDVSRDDIEAYLEDNG